MCDKNINLEYRILKKIIRKIALTESKLEENSIIILYILPLRNLNLADKKHSSTKQT